MQTCLGYSNWNDEEIVKNEKTSKSRTLKKRRQKPY